MESHQDDWSAYTPDFPIPISFISGHYLLFDVRAVSYLRREHKVCGYNIGTLPQSPSQNVFLGLPTLIMPEEAQLLIEKGLAHLLDDARAHDLAVYNRKQARQAEYMAKVQRQAGEVEKMRAREHQTAKRRALSKKANNSKTKDKSDDSTPPSSLLDFDDEEGPESPEPTTLDNTSKDTPIKLSSNPAHANTYYVTPTTSRILLDPASSQEGSKAPPKRLSNVPSSYPLFRHLHSRGYFMTPGLRFGCQYTAYPGDPLRFHSHFLAVGFEWEQEIDMMEIVGGGRLGTGVKKGFLIGGEEPTLPPSKNSDEDGKGEPQDETDNRVRTFSIEWAVM